MAGLLAGLGLLAGPAGAQGWLGLAQSNYGGTNGAYFNPSSLADSRLRADRDHDGVSNRCDQCPRAKGDWASRGCPPLGAPASPGATG